MTRRPTAGWTRGGVLFAAALLACSPPQTAKPPTSAPASAGPPAIVAAPPAVTPTSAPVYDVIIVGAGMAGLTAAREMQRHGHPFVVLEATGRKGGRAIATDPADFGIPIDLGGAWIHGVKTNPLTPIVDGLGFQRIVTHVEPAAYFFHKGRFATKAEQAEFRRDLKTFEEGLEAHVEAEYAAADARRASGLQLEGAALATAQAADTAARFLPPASRRFHKLVALTMGPLESAEELGRSSAVDVSEFISADDAFIDRGFGGFVAEYGKDVPVELNQKVKTIRHGADGVVVTTASGATYRGRKVLVTVSTGVLQAGHIKFEPDLPGWKKDAIAELKMGVLDKVILGFRSDVFPRPPGPDGRRHDLANTWVLYDGEGEDHDMAFVIRPGEQNVAVGFFGGDRARALEAQGEEKMIKVTLEALADICEKDVSGELVRTKVTNWHTTEWTLGAYSAANPGAWEAHEKLGLPIDDRVYFAGEACGGSSYNGSFAAAYNSALQASFAIHRGLADAPGR